MKCFIFPMKIKFKVVIVILLSVSEYSSDGQVLGKDSVSFFGVLQALLALSSRIMTTLFRAAVWPMCQGQCQWSWKRVIGILISADV